MKIVLRGFGWTFTTVVGIALVLITVLPLVSALSTSLQPEGDIFSTPIKFIPQNWTFDNYLSLVNDPKFSRGFVNSLLITVVSTIFTALFAAPAAYAISRHRFPFDAGRKIGTTFLLVRLLPPFALVVPLFLTLRGFGLLDSTIGLIIVYTGIHMPLAIWIIQPTVAQVPREVTEAATIDGAGTFQTFFRVVFPLLRPSIATAAAFSAIFSWNEFFYSLILTFNKAKTFPVALAGLIGDSTPAYGQLAAAGIVASIPAILFVVFVQRALVGGLSAGAVR